MLKFFGKAVKTCENSENPVEEIKLIHRNVCPKPRDVCTFIYTHIHTHIYIYLTF